MMYPVRPKRVFKLFVILVIAICLAPCIIFYGKRESYDKGETSGASASGRSDQRKFSHAERNVPAATISTTSRENKNQQRFINTREVQSTSQSFSNPFTISKKDVSEIDAIAFENHLENKRDGRTKSIAVIQRCKNDEDEFRSFEFFQHCPKLPCRWTTDLEKADAVVFFVTRLRIKTCIPKFRRPSGQRWVMWTYEPPFEEYYFYVLDFSSLKGQFNWTMTYRLDSDIVLTYGRLEEQELPLKNYTQIYEGKNITAAWFVSNCRDTCGRRVYAERMKSVTDIHIFGRCGDLNCSGGGGKFKRNKDGNVCFPMLSRSYFFYLAFENSLCKDYVTEKFFKIFSGVDVIPVVRGGANYKRFFPPGTFIDASDFASPEDLAKFLLNLSKDRKRYIDMLEKKSRYVSRSRMKTLCPLCDKLLTDDSEKSYPDLRTWYIQDQCHEPTDL